MDYLTPLSTFYRENPDYNAIDRESEFYALKQRQDAIDDLLNGKISPDDLFDLLDYQDIDPMEYAGLAAASMNRVMDSGIEITGWR